MASPANPNRIRLISHVVMPVPCSFVRRAAYASNSTFRVARAYPILNRTFLSLRVSLLEEGYQPGGGPHSVPCDVMDPMLKPDEEDTEMNFCDGFWESEMVTLTPMLLIRFFSNSFVDEPNSFGRRELFSGAAEEEATDR
eukprot:CAMPEP_0183297718 /NCGR_PEP_ID=MMETSP0160_2-20130417/4931_1 /TAXON_ID=2839 ORGANISM="Odontella Sinensis, Strain Grunow 1884" /NCGR_SAMPLE_ID=MMETSP0160_2 /ASSEMBLY_ACC=CAM_ASM_000250 /LENGTH=139 /DNA_ID=CAMNT_0025459593 /DNA_START=331 /DNA_END=747 /DNA_ORIENTATION=-